QDELALIAKFSHHPIVKLAIQLCDEDVSYEELVQRVRQEESLKDLDGRDIEFVNRFVSDFTSQQLGLAGAAVIPEMHKLATVLTHELSMLRFTEHISESALATGLQMLATKEFSAATKCCIRAIETLPSDKPELEPRAYNYLGIAYYRQGKIDSAIQNYKQAIQVSERLGEKYWRSKALGNLGMAYQDLGSIDSALKFYEDALEISRELKDRWEEGR
ncbi:tetratricopeptide repeat protein, partial [candidate division KSB1 bacterium]|nr:tetratricopeptide repeat protein [candidate division KSB1 bacterium]NIV68921.1 tetratricopeptide repeat protein [Phycisphaerae bacterium]NIS22707.1 tetratricopeptide repeat protein [candidate division KSB1 bacterium]NIT69553.1 tetratricopeptide repeat protein [candidate division KSB1 bacterium]NIU23207.1 tetratricopeptide repeat protein [candidate division KSB1 bacterium]